MEKINIGKPKAPHSSPKKLFSYRLSLIANRSDTLVQESQGNKNEVKTPYFSGLEPYLDLTPGLIQLEQLPWGVRQKKAEPGCPTRFEVTWVGNA